LSKFWTSFWKNFHLAPMNSSAVEDCSSFFLNYNFTKITCYTRIWKRKEEDRVIPSIDISNLLCNFILIERQDHRIICKVNEIKLNKKMKFFKLINYKRINNSQNLKSVKCESTSDECLRQRKERNSPFASLSSPSLQVNVVPQLNSLHDKVRRFNLRKFSSGSVGLRPPVEGRADGSDEHEEEGSHYKEPGDAAKRITDERKAACHGGGHRRSIEVFVDNLIDNLIDFVRRVVFVQVIRRRVVAGCCIGVVVRWRIVWPLIGVGCVEVVGVVVVAGVVCLKRRTPCRSWRLGHAQCYGDGQQDWNSPHFFSANKKHRFFCWDFLIWFFV